MAKAVNPAALAVAQQAATAQGETLSGPFAPGLPLTPYDGVSGMPRAWNFPTGYNIKSRADRDGRIDFTLLKILTDTYDVASMCINHRIDDVRSLNWSIRSADWVEKGDGGDAVDRAKAALRRPDGRNTFRAWLAMWLQDILRYDAGCLYRRRNMIDQVCGLEVVSGTTIAPVLDYYGRRPASPAPAYVQYVNGQPWEWLTEDDIIYAPFRPQPDSPYGISPLESVLLTANTDMRFQNHWMNWFTEGNMPEGFATAPADITTPEQLAQWQAYWEAMNTDMRTKHKLKMIPHDTVLSFPKEKAFDPTFPKFLMGKVCAAYHVTPNDLGFTEDVNRATGDTQVDVQFRIGTLPLVRHIEDILTSYLQDDLGLPVVFEFDTGQESEDRVATAQADQIYIQNGVVSVDEVREKVYGLPTDAQRPTPRFIFSARQGPIPLRSLLDVAGPVDPQTAAPSEELPLDTTAFDGTPGVLPDKAPGAPQFARAPTDPDEPNHPELEIPVPGSGLVGAPPPAPAPAPVDPEVVKELARWRSNTITRLGRGQAPRPFEPQAMPVELRDAVWKQLRHVRTRHDADVVFDQIRKATAPAPAKWNPLDPKGDTAAFGAIDAQEESDLENQEDAELGVTADSDDPGESEQSQEESELLPTELGPGATGAAVVTTGAGTATASERNKREEKPKFRSEAEEATPQQTVDVKLADHWAPAISDALQGLIDEETIHSIAVRAHEAIADVINYGAEMEAARAADASRLSNTLDGLWADAYGVGQLAAQVQIQGPSDDWKGWAPGNPVTPSLHDISWMNAMQSRGLTLNGITDTTMAGMSSVLEKGVKDGLSVDDLAAALGKYISDPNRAYTIAQTESARLLSAGTMKTYREAGLTDWDLVVSAGACMDCESIAMDNPHSVYDDESAPPLHPRCRCSVAPTEEAAKGATQDILGDRADDGVQLDDPNLVTVDGETIPIITEDEKRGNAQPVSRDEFTQIAGDGKAMLDEMRANGSPPTGLTENLDAIKASTYDQVLQSWGGATIDSHSGETLASDADKYAVTVKPAGLESVSIHENPTQEEWGKAMDEAMSRFGDTLAAQSHYLGVFHDDDLGRIDIDPVVVVDTQKQSEAIGAYTHNIGGAYNFADGNGYWPPYVEGTAAAVAKSQDKTHFRGIGEWYAQNRRLNGQPDGDDDDEGDGDV